MAGGLLGLALLAVGLVAGMLHIEGLGVDELDIAVKGAVTEHIAVDSHYDPDTETGTVDFANTVLAAGIGLGGAAVLAAADVARFVETASAVGTEPAVDAVKVDADTEAADTEVADTDEADDTAEAADTAEVVVGIVEPGNFGVAREQPSLGGVAGTRKL